MCWGFKLVGGGTCVGGFQEGRAFYPYFHATTEFKRLSLQIPPSSYVAFWFKLFSLSLGNWGDTSNMWVIFTDNVQDGQRGTGGEWTNPNHANHAACWMR